MLTKRTSHSLRQRLPRRQSGVVLMVALIMLVAMTLAGLALVRSMDTTNLVAGNMAFQQSATHSADAGVEAAVAWLEGNNATGVLDQNVPAAGYTASTLNNVAYPLGAAYWTALLPNGVCSLPLAGGACSAAPGVVNVSGNLVSFMIQRLCTGAGPRNQTGSGCAISPGTSSTKGNNEGAGEDQLTFSTAVYYRITVRVAGPRNTVSYVQAIVSM
jgi:Tfp pilus assembly protein PilX